MDYQYNLKILKQEFKQEKEFTLFLGAGINASGNVKLLWSDLIGETCNYAFRRIGDNLNLRSEDTKQLLSLLGIEYFDWKNNPITTNDVIDRISFTKYVQLKKYITSHLPVEIQVSIIKTLVGDAYIPLLQSYIYTQCNKEIIRRLFERYTLSERERPDDRGLFTLFVLARMILLNPQIKNIVTYNYDNFLSYAVCYLLSNSERLSFIALKNDCPCFKGNS